jgi:hypothetical protein
VVYCLRYAITGEKTIKKTITMRMIVVMGVEHAREKEQPYTLEEETGIPR